MCARTDRKLEAAHIVPRSLGGQMVAASIVPLCGPIGDPASCHDRYDRLRLNLIPHLRDDEIAEAERVLGPARARRRLGGVNDDH